jgi:hypothetical protein
MASRMGSKKGVRNRSMRNFLKQRAHWQPQALALAVLAAVFIALVAGTATSADARRSSGDETHSWSEGRPVVQLARTQFSVKGAPEGVRLVASQRHAAAIYLDREGHAGPLGIEADFGSLGKISARFRPSGRVTSRLPNIGVAGGCTPPRGALDRLGTFVGEIRFRGENGFTSINRRRVSGRVSPERVVRCPAKDDSRNEQSQAKVRPTRLSVNGGLSFPLASFDAGHDVISEIASLVRSGVSLGLSSLPDRGVPFKSEVIEERRNFKMLVIRLAVAKGADGSFEVNDKLRTATVTPPPPFAGSAQVNNCVAPRFAWRGSLSVSLPGRGRISLVAPRFGGELSPYGRCPKEG